MLERLGPFSPVILSFIVPYTLPKRIPIPVPYPTLPYPYPTFERLGPISPATLPLRVPYTLPMPIPIPVPYPTYIASTQSSNFLRHQRSSLALHDSLFLRRWKHLVAVHRLPRLEQYPIPYLYLYLYLYLYPTQPT